MLQFFCAFSLELTEPVQYNKHVCRLCTMITIYGKLSLSMLGIEKLHMWHTQAEEASQVSLICSIQVNLEQPLLLLYHELYHNQW